jgi:hypothetical protein
MSRLSIEDRLQIMEMVSRIAAEAVKGQDMARDLDLQVQLFEDLYHTMVGLVEEDEEGYEDEEP